MSDAPAGKFFGALLMAVGVLIAGASGLCSLVVLGGVLRQLLLPPHAAATAMIPVVLVVGGAPFAIGVLLVLSGWRMLRKPPPLDVDTFR